MWPQAKSAPPAVSPHVGTAPASACTLYDLRFFVEMEPQGPQGLEACAKRETVTIDSVTARFIAYTKCAADNRWYLADVVKSSKSVIYGEWG